MIPDILPKKSVAIRWGKRAALVVGEPILTQGLTLEETVARLYAQACELSGGRP